MLVKKASFVVVVLSLLVANVVSADQRSEEAEANRTRAGCKEDGNQTEMNFCAAAEFHKADLELNALYKTQIARLTEPEKSRLKDAQKAWITFRDKSCLYEARAQNESGSIWASDHFSCMATHTKQRIEDLKSYVECTENGCPD